MLETVKENGIKAVGEAVFCPGTSLLLDGDIKAGGGHAIIGVAAGLIFGRIGWVLVALNSFSKSATGKYLHQQFRMPSMPAAASPTKSK
ncbi:MAG TPA: DUF6072 family protein [Bryobacteraceae bacterium]|nr:DUF6072 family protein [Bryobacteraceae bacterium]